LTQKCEKVNQESDNNVPKCMAKQKNFTGVNKKAESDPLCHTARRKMELKREVCCYDS
jgi:hypothetical protein